MLLVVNKSSSMTKPHAVWNRSIQMGHHASRAGCRVHRIDGTNNDMRATFNLGLELFPYDPSSFGFTGKPGSQRFMPSSCGERRHCRDYRFLCVEAQRHLRRAQRTIPGGQTPTAEALLQAYNYFTVGDGQCLNGEKYVVLVTNGGADCNVGLPAELILVPET